MVAVRRILVAQSVGLWIGLNRRLAGVGSVDLVETPTLDASRVLTELERPAIVVFSDEDAIQEAERLVADLGQLGCTETRVALAADGLAPTRRPLPADNRSLVICSPSDLVQVVTELLALDEEPEERLDMLVHYRSERETASVEGFVIVLALDEKNLLLQADQPFEIEEELALDFLLPGSAPDSARERVSLTCRVEGCQDDADLIYAARVSSSDANATAAVQHFLARSRS